MRFNKFIFLLLVALIMGLAATAAAQQDPNDEAVRGSFITSRPPAAAGGGVTVSTSSSSKSSSKSSGKSSGKSTGKSSSGKSTSGKSTSGKSTSGKSTGTTVEVKTYSSGPIGLGYTLYMRDGMGDAMRIDPSREFVAGDRIRLSMEANTDGYLYVFHTENDNAPTLIFPDSRLNDGDNSIEAHVPYEVPSPFEISENLRWFAFDEKPANERLYIVITREPIPGIPIGNALVSHCKKTTSICPLRMLPEVWAKATQGSSGGVKVSKSKTYGQTQTQGEREATTRGLGLNQNAPEPSVVRMNVSTNDSVLVTTLDLVHR